MVSTFQLFNEQEHKEEVTQRASEAFNENFVEGLLKMYNENLIKISTDQAIVIDTECDQEEHIETDTLKEDSSSTDDE